jgi:hypothetical protein
MTDFVGDVLNELRGASLKPSEVNALIAQIIVCTVHDRDVDLDLEEALVLGGLRLFRKSPRENRLAIARKWLIDYGILEEQLDELIVMAKLAREDL